MEDEAPGNGRDRYWRSVHRGVVSEPEDLARQELGGEFLRAVAQLAADRILRFGDVLEDAPAILGGEWARSWNLSDWGST